ncbi:aldehyde dehydrogenase family protein [Streptomyces sp. WAC05374]|uniref:aldehyde dehydrogenase family protein n=1 Tax=Streptomyces sp. WAC05374 TaxID=2487420 RepID=UPI000F88FD29|nr:aldehyde dehydrogenase family protein [Streptomyces sp. WAC05374]RST16605.1 aldehyde dehydrogenase family protein [Streptomyces sp. WAC05374]TDF47141.1 aldehyde dehydrogenase family protein [Streptomyces sp. WAC05374]TDF57399.1 aldehyde dehydrogenase family protein [Streptomyces sp. WAC05374]TDF61504.1 aldehyde dehydrogenase family protein [Streptomyces sp. WAC05374]
MRLFIGGEWAEPEGGHYEVVDPATEEVVGLAPEASRRQVHEAAAAARAAFAGWSATRPEERAAVLDRAAGIMARDAEAHARLARAESGATAATARAMQVGVGIARFRRYARGALEPVERPLPPQISGAGPMGPASVLGAVAVRRPVGVVTCVTSYNNPWANPAGKIAPALAMGNTVVVKPAPQDPLSVYAMARALQEAGVPPGVVNVVSGSGAEAGEAAVDSPDVDMVSFTGSTAVGRRIGEVCGRELKRQLMELGGKGAALVFDDADLGAAVRGVGTTFSFYSGQICTAPTRVLAQRGVYERLVEGLAGYARRLTVGDPADPGTVVGPVVSAAHRDRVEGYVELGREEGARVVVGGERPALDRGFYVAPALLADCTSRMRVVREEIFGPVVVVVPFDDEEEGVALANDTDYGLIDYVWSGDVARAFRVAGRLRAGGVGVNTIGRNMEAPFGGFKQSGVGRDCGSWALHAYSETQAVVWPG